MRSFFAFFFAAAFAGLALGKVIELGDSDFESKLETIDVALVMFYAPWCGHCKKMKPEFEAASVDLGKGEYPVTLAKVDCTEAGKETCSKFGVSGYPTVKIFRSGEVSSDYNGPREAAGIVKHMRSQVGPASKELTDDKAHDKFVDGASDVVIIGNLPKDEDMEAFQKVASTMRETATFGHSKKATPVRKAGVHLHRPKHLRTKMEDSVVTFKGDTSDSKAVTAFIKDNYHGLVGHRTQGNMEEFQRGPLLVAYYAVDYTLNPKGTNYWRNRVMKVAKANKGKKGLKFAVSNSGEFARELEEFGLSPEEERPVVAIKDETGKKFVMSEDFSVDSLTAFVEKWSKGEVEAYLKSEPVPDSNDSPVKVAVGKNFDELVTNSEKDVLVEFYAPWCGHCKSLAPVYDELGEKMEGENVEIVKMDATANDAPSAFDVRGFPTIYWVKKGEAPVRYEGGRAIDDFVKYIAKAATKELKGYDRKGKEKKSKEEL